MTVAKTLPHGPGEANAFMAAHAADLVAGYLEYLAVPAFPDAGALDYTLDSLYQREGGLDGGAATVVVRIY